MFSISFLTTTFQPLNELFKFTCSVRSMAAVEQMTEFLKQFQFIGYVK
jgi:hypothetical protein